MKTIGRPALGALALTLSVVVLAACATATPSDSPGPSASTSSQAEGSPSASPSAEDASASPSSAPSSAPLTTHGPTPKPGSLVLAWHRSADVAAPNDSWWSWAGGGQSHAWTKLGGLYVMPVDTNGYDSGAQAGPQIWLSNDLLHWHKASVPATAGRQVSATAVTLGGPGLVAIGVDWGGDALVDVTWTSTDGETWTRVEDAATGLTAGQLWLLSAVGGGMVSFVDGPVDVTKFAGDAFDAVQYPRLIVSQGSATAFVSDSETNNPVAIWQAIGTTGWHKVGTLPKSGGASLFDAVQGPHGYLVLGCGANCSGTVGWTSVDGVDWRSSNMGTFDNVNAILADQSGFIAVGQRVTGKGCAVAESDIYGESWTSSDGRTWRKMKDEAQFDHASIYVLIPRARTLFGVGMRWTADHAVPTVWTTTLPANSVSSGSGSTPTPAPGSSGGCGD